MRSATPTPAMRAIYPAVGAMPPVAVHWRPSVLVVEDEPAIRMLLRDLLEDAGMHVEDAKDAETALRLLSVAAEAGGRYRVLVTDVNLGRGLDGVALAALARRQAPNIHVVYVTGNPERVFGRSGGSGLRERVIGKPFANSELVATVRGLAASPAPGTDC